MDARDTGRVTGIMIPDKHGRANGLTRILGVAFADDLCIGIETTMHLERLRMMLEVYEEGSTRL